MNYIIRLRSTDVQMHLTSDVSCIDGTTGSTSTKFEVLPGDTTDSFNTSIEHSPNQIQTRQNGKISREYLSQHISYRAQRLASKVEADKVNVWFSSSSSSYQ
jgi:hypothetical protein